MQTVRAIFPLDSFGKIEDKLILRESDSPSQFHHLVRVLRVKGGWELELLDESSPRKISTSVVECSASALTLKVNGEVSQRIKNPLTLLLALPEFDVLERVIEKGTELQVGTIKIFIPQHTQHKDALTRLSGKIQRLEKIRNAARIQSGSGPVNLEIYTNLEEAVSSLKDKNSAQEIRLIASLQSGAANLQEFLQKNHPLERQLKNTDILLVVGPEGDLSVEEYKLCSENGFFPISLGQSVLRVETAAIVSAFTIFNYFNR